ncbi:MAG: formylglycine-generating enzyme family protein [Thermoguttaceae bacterium]
MSTSVPRVPRAALLIAAMLAGCAKPQVPSTDGAMPKIVRAPSGAEMVLVPAGSFDMGDGDGAKDEIPLHTVHLDAFWMDRTEVTQEQFARLEMADPSHFKDPQNPVEQINWPQAVLFCNRRSQAEGLQSCYNEQTVECNYRASGYRLPTEAEWEYACRAGSASAYSFRGGPRELGEHAWFAENSSKRSHPVGQKKANPWGLFDMHGNVAEWCNDVYDKAYYGSSPSDNPRGPAEGKAYVLRGGGWSSSADRLRCGARMYDNPGFADACLARDAIGFRCVRRPLPGEVDDLPPSKCNHPP